MALKEMHNPTRTATVEQEKTGPVTTTTTTSRALEALTGLKGYRFFNLTTFRKNGVAVVTTVLLALANDKKINVWTTKD